MAKAIKLAAIAARINAHLKRFERDPAINTKTETKTGYLLRFWGAGSGASGRYVYVTYVSYQGQSHLTRAEAELYLSKLDAGFIGSHWQALREAAQQEGS